jgi:hypothetical protein
MRNDLKRFNCGLDLSENKIRCYVYKNPPFKKHENSLKPGVNLPALEIDENYMEKTDKK